MRAAFTAWIALIVAAAATVGLALQPDAPQLSIGPLTPMSQGDVQRVPVDGAGPATKVSGSAFERSFHLSPGDGGTWEGLLGADVAQPAGTYPIVVTAIRPDGGTATAHTTLTVKARRFTTRRLSVDRRFIEPSQADAARMATDSGRLAAILDSVSERRWRGPFTPPVPGNATSNFGSRSVFNGQPRAPHAGIDYRGAAGTPVTAPNAGRVVLAEDLFLTGQTVVLDHGLGLYSLFAHLSRMDVTVGADVATGSPVGLVGATGRVTGPHLHWSVRLAGARVDPAVLLRLTF